MAKTMLYDLSKGRMIGLDPSAWPEIGMIDRMAHVGDVIRVDGMHYAVGLSDTAAHAAGVWPCAIRKKPEEVEFAEHITCPYCGHQDLTSFEADAETDADAITCGRCGAKLRYERHITIEYTTKPVRPPKIILAHWRCNDAEY